MEDSPPVTNYYCRYCNTSWPLSYFKNSQQFGAHCSNCSRRKRPEGEVTVNTQTKVPAKRKRKKRQRQDKSLRQRPPPIVGSDGTEKKRRRKGTDIQALGEWSFGGDSVDQPTCTSIDDVDSEEEEREAEDCHYKNDDHEDEIYHSDESDEDFVIGRSARSRQSTVGGGASNPFLTRTSRSRARRKPFSMPTKHQQHDDDDDDDDEDEVDTEISERNKECKPTNQDRDTPHVTAAILKEGGIESGDTFLFAEDIAVLGLIPTDCTDDGGDQKSVAVVSSSPSCTISTSTSIKRETSLQQRKQHSDHDGEGFHLNNNNKRNPRSHSAITQQREEKSHVEYNNDRLDKAPSFKRERRGRPRRVPLVEHKDMAARKEKETFLPLLSVLSSRSKVYTKNDDLDTLGPQSHNTNQSNDDDNSMSHDSDDDNSNSNDMNDTNSNDEENEDNNGVDDTNLGCHYDSDEEDNGNDSAEDDSYDDSFYEGIGEAGCGLLVAAEKERGMLSREKEIRLLENELIVLKNETRLHEEEQDREIKRIKNGVREELDSLRRDVAYTLDVTCAKFEHDFKAGEKAEQEEIVAFNSEVNAIKSTLEDESSHIGLIASARVKTSLVSQLDQVRHKFDNECKNRVVETQRNAKRMEDSCRTQIRRFRSHFDKCIGTKEEETNEMVLSSRESLKDVVQRVHDGIAEVESMIQQNKTEEYEDIG